MPFESHHDPQRLVDELTADLEPDDAIELAAELTRMIDLGLLELEGDAVPGEDVRIGIVGSVLRSSS
jgi:hypothetical protein